MVADGTVPPRPELKDFQRNPFAGDVPSVQMAGTALVSVEQQRAVAEVQARMMIARANPRNPMAAMDAIIRDCTRPTLAKRALYEYARGGQDITGPSIRLMEVIAQRWGNIASGLKEISRANGHSECVAYAWDLETGFYDERQFQVKHWRDTKQGGYLLTDERDIYELIANMGQRRKRAVMIAVIPGDVIEAAVEQVEQTLNAEADTSPEALQRMMEAFKRFGVSQKHIEQRIQRKLEAIRPAQVVQLSKIFTSLNDGMSQASDWFQDDAWQEIGRRHEAAAAASEEPTKPKRTRATAKTQEQQPPQDEQVRSGPAVTEPAGDAERAAPAGTAVADEEGFSVWLLDETGEPTEMYSDPFKFAEALAALCAAGHTEQILQENADSIDLAVAANPKVGTIIDGIATGTEGDATEATPEPVVVQVTKDRAGKVDVKVYMADVRQAVGALTAVTYNDFIAANLDNLKTLDKATKSLVLAALSKRADELQIDRPTHLAEALKSAPAPVQDQSAPPPSEDPDIRLVDTRAKAFDDCSTLIDLDAYARGSIIASLSNRLRSEGKGYLVDRLLDAYWVRSEMLGGPGKPA